jgi:hypothetical protein
MNSIAIEQYKTHLLSYDSFNKYRNKSESLSFFQFKTNRTNFNLFDAIYNFYKRYFGLKKSQKEDIFIVIILVSLIIYIIILVKIFIFDILKHLYEYYNFARIHRKYKAFFFNQVELLLNEKGDLGIEVEFNSRNNTAINNMIDECSLDSYNSLSDNLGNFDFIQSSSKDLNTNPLTLNEYLNKNEKNLKKLAKFYANICTRLELANETAMLPDIEFFIEWILIVEDAKRKIKKIKQKYKFIYYY